MTKHGERNEGGENELSATLDASDNDIEEDPVRCEGTTIYDPAMLHMCSQVMQMGHKVSSAF